MAKKLLLAIAFLLVIVDFSSCTMHVVSGTPYRVWHPAGRFSKHWGRERHFNNRRAHWGRHRSGMKVHPYRGHFHE